MHCTTHRSVVKLNLFNPSVIYIIIMRYSPDTKQRVISLRTQGMPLSIIQKKVGISYSGVRSCLVGFKFPLSHPNYVQFPQSLKKLAVSLRKNGVSKSLIAKKINVPYDTVSAWLSKHKFDSIAHPLYKNASIQHDYFSEKNLDKHPERFVIVGFIAADGCIYDGSCGQKRLVFNICERDEISLDIINRELSGGERRVSYLKNTNSLMLYFPSDAICNDLSRYNILPRKSLSYDLPNLSVEQMSYFIRGYYYGDGCFSLGKTAGKTGYFLVGSTSFAVSLQKYLVGHNILDRCPIYLNRSGNVYNIVIKGSQAVKFSKYAMSNDKLILIPRKHKRIEDLFSNSPLCLLKNDKKHYPRMYFQ